MFLFSLISTEKIDRSSRGRLASELLIAAFLTGQLKGLSRSLALLDDNGSVSLSLTACLSLSLSLSVCLFTVTLAVGLVRTVLSSRAFFVVDPGLWNSLLNFFVFSPFSNLIQVQT